MNPEPTVLVTGFEPFGRWRVNSSWEAVTLLERRLGPRVRVARLPVDRRRAAAMLTALLRQHRPAACLLTGLARGSGLRIERWARRPRSLAGADAPGRLAGSWPVVEQGLALRLSRLPCRISANAGRYVCDSTYWALLDFRMKYGFPYDATFLHLPPLSGRFSSASLARGLERVIRRRLVRIAASETGR